MFPVLFNVITNEIQTGETGKGTDMI